MTASATTLLYKLPWLDRVSSAVDWSTNFYITSNALAFTAPALLVVGTVAGADATSGEYDPFELHYRQLRSLRTDPSLWNTDTDAEPPSSQSIAWAEAVLQRLEADALLPTRVVASAEGGVAICFVRGDAYSDIEILNSGQILGVTTDRVNRPMVWEIGSDARDIAGASATIRAFFEANKTGKDVPEWQKRRYWIPSLAQTLSTL